MQDRQKESICTVLLISYNHAPYFREAIESVLHQKTKYSYEIHIWDDASTDGTIDIIKEYEKQYPDIVTAHIAAKNQGAQTNIWNAYSCVATKYCILLETDDFWCDDFKLDRQIKALEKNPDCSFCGHNTSYYAMNEQCREYEEGSQLCTAQILKSKSVFTYEDFYPIISGGYIPYISTRLIRTACISLKDIQYKESFLFDHTQFYYLLLKGNLYYIDKPMSVYRRTGKGTCSEKRPLEFLNTFIQNSLDFNKETNFSIADKIFADCILQSDFRLKLDTAYRAKTITLVANPQKANLVSPIAIGDTMILAGFKKEIEKKFKVSLLYIIKPQYVSIMEMYGIRDYKIVPNMDSIDWDLVEDKADTPQIGKLYFGHPTFYQEYQSLYDSLRYKRLDINFLTFFKKFLNLPAQAEFKLPITPPTLSAEGKNAIENMPLDKVVLFFPEAASCPELPLEFWIEKIQKVKQQGYHVFINSKEKYDIEDTANIFLSVKDTIALACQCHAVYSLRSGMCDVIAPFCKNLTVYYPSHADLFIFSLPSMYGERCKHVKEELALPPLPPQPFSSGNNHPLKPHFLGVFPVPNLLYSFYLNHKHLFKRVKKLVRWK